MIDLVLGRGVLPAALLGELLDVARKGGKVGCACNGR